MPVYSDAFYREAPQTRQPSYGYSPAEHFAQASGKEETETPKRHRIPVLIAVFCFLCGLFVAYMSFGMMYLLKEDRTADSGSVTREIYEDFFTDGLLTNSSLPLTTSSSEGQNVQKAEDIYVTACASSVGVTIRGYVQNVFGQNDTDTVTGGGIVLSEDGYVLTNYHVIRAGYEAGRTVSVITEERGRYEAEVVGIDEDSDLALLHIDAQGLTAAVLGDPEELLVGQRIFAVGNPLGELTNTMTSGIVSSCRRRIELGQDIEVDMIQFDAAVNRGNSGGPLYNEYGQVVGIVTAKYSRAGYQGLAFAIPIDDACRIATELADNGYVSGKPYLGLSLATVTSSSAQYYGFVQGVYVTSVEADSAAEKAGIAQGDIITGIDGTEVLTTSELVSAVRNGYHAGDSAELTVWRDQDYMTVTVVFDEKLPGAGLTDEETVLRDSGAFTTGEN